MRRCTKAGIHQKEKAIPLSWQLMNEEWLIKTFQYKIIIIFPQLQARRKKGYTKISCF